MKKTALTLLLALLMAAALLTSGALASDDEAGPVARVGNVEYDNFNDALKALKESETEYWIDLLRDVTIDDAQYVIDSIVQIDGHGHKLTLNAPEDEDACIFTILGECFLEIRNTELYINGNGEGTVFKIDGEEYNNTAVYFYISDAYITGFENVFDFVEVEDYKDIVVHASLLNITDISGSVSNGGNWNIWGNMNISDCTGTGLTADYIGIYGDASLNVSGVGSSGVVTGGLSVAENSSLTVSGCGSELPIASAGAPDGVSYKYPVEIRAGGNVTIGYDSELVLEGNNINSVYLVSGSFSNESEVNTDVVSADENFCKVEIEGWPTQVIPKGEYELVMPEAPSKSGYIFLGWSYNGSTYAPGDVVPIDGPMTVKAVWGSLPSVSEPEETPAEPVTPAPVYTDVSTGDWYYEAVEYVSSEGLMDGVSEGEFAPGATLTRAMVWTILARAEGVDTGSGSSWYAAAQEWAAAKGVSDGEQPGGAITREQLVTMLYRLAGEPETTGELTAPDAASVSSWAKAAMIWAMENGLIEGDETGAVNPGATATRAQTAALLSRYLTA